MYLVNESKLTQANRFNLYFIYRFIVKQLFLKIIEYEAETDFLNKIRVVNLT